MACICSTHGGTIIRYMRACPVHGGAVDWASRQEREACASLAGAWPERQHYTSDRLTYGAQMAAELAEAIRARNPSTQGPAMDAERKRMHDELGALKSAFAGDHPGITHAMDVAATALLDAMQTEDTHITPMLVTKHMFKAVMEAGFMIMHRDEMQNALLAAGRAGKILNLQK